MKTLADAVLAFAGLDAATLLAILTPLVAVPMGIITFHLRGLRDELSGARDELSRRIEKGESAQRDMGARLADFEREFAAKEDWVRESMLARRGIERLTESVARLETRLDRTNPSDPISPSFASRESDRHAYCEGTD